MGPFSLHIHFLYLVLIRTTAGNTFQVHGKHIRRKGAMRGGPLGAIFNMVFYCPEEL